MLKQLIPHAAAPQLRYSLGKPSAAAFLAQNEKGKGQLNPAMRYTSDGASDWPSLGRHDVETIPYNELETTHSHS